MYQAWYRKYRPKVFKDLIGQPFVAKILTNSIKQQNFGHAFLFSGGRGTGKTSAARIFAKAINCLKPIEGEPCLSCSACVQIAAGSTDIFEIDAASNNGVEEIRSVIENSKYYPGQMRYKVFIIDEAHMLTQNAWNALLKTLEEPPEYLVFILATTETHKIPQTVLSRCEHHAFKTPTINEISTALNLIIKAERVEFEPAAVELIAAMAEGALRDSIKLLEQFARLYNNQPISAEEIRNSVGAVSTLQIVELLNSHNNTSRTIEIINDLETKHIDFGKLISEICELLVEKQIYELSNHLYVPAKISKPILDSLSCDLNQAKHLYKEMIDLLPKLKFSRNHSKLLTVALCDSASSDYSVSHLKTQQSASRNHIDMKPKKPNPETNTEIYNQKIVSQNSDLKTLSPKEIRTNEIFKVEISPLDKSATKNINEVDTAQHQAKEVISSEKLSEEFSNKLVKIFFNSDKTYKDAVVQDFKKISNLLVSNPVEARLFEGIIILAAWNNQTIGVFKDPNKALRVRARINDNKIKSFVKLLHAKSLELNVVSVNEAEPLYRKATEFKTSGNPPSWLTESEKPFDELEDFVKDIV